MPAFEEAVRAGADFVETDVHRTRDGALVCIHDATLNRTTNGDGYVSEKTVDYVRSLDAGSWFSGRYAGVQVPLFEEFLDYIASTSAGVFVEVKVPGIEEEVVGRILQWGLEERAVVLSGYWSVLRRVKELDPGIATLADLPSPSPQSISSAVKVANIVSIHAALFEEEHALQAHRRGLLVNVWGVNGCEDALRVVELGADFVTVDNPGAIVECLRARGLHA
ncbi:glycerophosphoryl diester phosphodiesterase [Thermofilum pendens Hrk 5]|uniref:Glycerophosphoryl diester phosphodiesterase n=2 Tax=Thermofilum pendens TaxID=2269 RepID=A1S151_THEPD|nr:glycerophosphoryl diester phosphodiesterase [Thermofilum pendens Hrk 5]